MSSALVKASHVVSIKICTLLVTVLVSVVLSRNLGADGRGQYYILATIINLGFAFGHLSIDHAHIPLWRSASLRRKIVHNSVWLGITLGGISAGVTILTCLVANNRGWVTVPSMGLLAVSTVAIPLNCLTAYTYGIIVLRGQLVLLSRLQLAAAIAQGGMLMLLAVVGSLSVLTVMLTLIALSALPFAMALLAGHTEVGGLDKVLAIKTLRIGLGFHIFTIAQVLLLRIDILLLTSRVAVEQIGYYSLAVTLSSLVFVGTDVVSQMAVPAQGGGDDSDAISGTLLAVRRSALIAGAGGCVLALVSPFIIPRVFGASFAHSVPSLWLLTIGSFCLATVRPISNVLLRWECRRELALAAGIGLLLNVSANVILIPRHGIAGSAAASVIAYASIAGVLLVVWHGQLDRAAVPT